MKLAQFMRKLGEVPFEMGIPLKEIKDKTTEERLRNILVKVQWHSLEVDWATKKILELFKKKKINEQKN